MGKSACLPILNVNLTMKGDGDVVTRDDTSTRVLGYLFNSCLHYNKILVKVSDLSGVFNQLQFWYLDAARFVYFLHVRCMIILYVRASRGAERSRYPHNMPIPHSTHTRHTQTQPSHLKTHIFITHPRSLEGTAV